MKPLRCGIYKIVNIINGKIYVGSTIRRFRQRWWEHKDLLNKGIHHNPHLQSSWKKYGEGTFVFEVVESVERDSSNKEQLNDYLKKREDYYISLWDSINTGYNKWSSDRHVISEETIKKLSGRTPWNKGKKATPEAVEKNKQSHIGIQSGKNHPLYGKEHTKESKDKMSKSSSGVWARPGYREHQSNIRKGQIPWNKGIPHTEISKNKISESLSKSWEVTTPEGETISITNLAKFCRDNNLNVGNMALIARGGYSKYKGWKCKKVEESESTKG